MTGLARIQRYEWEDSLVEAQAIGLIPKYPVTSALLLARQINWKPRNGSRPALRWRNLYAAESVSIPRSTFFQHLRVLKDSGYLILERGNLAPTLPYNCKEISEAFKRRVSKISGTNDVTTSISSKAPSGSGLAPQSRSAISESSICNPFTDNSYTDNSFSEDL